MYRFRGACHNNVQISVLKCDILEAVDVFKSAIFSILGNINFVLNMKPIFGHFIACFFTS